MQISANLILDFRNEIKSYAKTLYTLGTSTGDSALADALSSMTGASASTVNIMTIKEKYINKFSDELNLGGVDKFMANRIAKQMATKVLEDAMLEVENSTSF